MCNLPAENKLDKNKSRRMSVLRVIRCEELLLPEFETPCCRGHLNYFIEVFWAKIHFSVTS